MENDKLLTYLIGFSIFKVILTFILLYIIYNKHRKLKELVNYRDQMYEIVSHDLQSPYFVYNTILERIRNFIKTKEISLINQELLYLENTFHSTKNILYNLSKWSQVVKTKTRESSEDFKVLDLINESIEHLRPFASINKIDLNIQVDENLIFKINKDAFQVLVRNLIDNAIKHSEASKIEVICRPVNKGLEIQINNNGIIISNEQKSSMMYIIKNGTHKEIKQRTGLGLLIISKYLKRLKGSLNISSIDDWNKFTLVLPK